MRSMEMLTSHVGAVRQARTGPRSRPMLRAVRNVTLSDPTTGERIEVVAGRDMIVPDHEVFRANPEARRHFELVDAVAEMKQASDEAKRESETVTAGREYWRLPAR